jgi:hypothetical protein
MAFENSKDDSGQTEITTIVETNEDLDLSVADEEGFEKLDDYDDEDDYQPQ